MKRSIGIMQVFCIFLSVAVLTGCMYPPDPNATTSQTTNTTAPTQSQISSVPSHSTQPSTTPTTQVPTTLPEATETTGATEGDYIGVLYTRNYLESLDNKLFGYGCGRNYNTTRPNIPIDCQKQCGSFQATFIEADTPAVYLTFDCGYEHQNLTASILDTLREKNIKAVFFVTMYYCKTQPQMVQRMIDEGHIVGNHSNGHRSLPTLDLDEMVYEIMSLHEYVKSNFGYEMTLFRPPKGEYSQRSLAVAQSLGYRSVFWSFAYQDWETDAQPDTQDAFETVSSCAHNGCIFLLHAVSTANAAILDDLIDDLQNRGYTLELLP